MESCTLTTRIGAQFRAQENGMNPLRRLTYSRGVRGLAKRLHLTMPLRSAYHWWVTSPGGILGIRRLGLNYKIRLQPEDLRNMEWDYFNHPSELVFLESLKAHLHSGDTALDVGAYYGEFTLPLAKIVGERGRVLAFEPAEAPCQRLLDNVKLNGLGNVQVFRKALGNEDSTGRLFSGGGSCPSIVPRDEDATFRSVSENIEIVRGDTFLAREKLPVPHAIKIDVEGFEYAVLQGLLGTLASPTCRLVCLEIHPGLLPSGVSAEAITELLLRSGFECLKTGQRVGVIHVVASKPACSTYNVAV